MKPFLQKEYQTYAGTADLFIYFVERGLNIAKDDGQFIYILPSKWMKSEYGEPLRQWVKQYEQEKIIDFGDLPVFEEATTYPCIWQIRKHVVETFSLTATIVSDLKLPKGLSQFVKDNSFEIAKASLTDPGWSLLNLEENNLTLKLQKNSMPLGKYICENLYRGVLTGFNEAFVIDESKKNEIISKDPTSAEIIKPFLAGKDISRYSQPHSSKYVIFAKRGIDIEKYPAILDHLTKYRERLEPKPKNWKGDKWNGRKEGSYKWYELQDAVDYFEKFEEPKIIYQEIAAYSTFTFDNSGLYINNKLFFIPTDNKNLLGLLNSKLCWFWLKRKSNILRGALALQSAYIFSIPVKDELLKSEELSLLIYEILSVKEQNPHADTASLERQIDDLIFNIYDLTQEEISLIKL